MRKEKDMLTVTGGKDWSGKILQVHRTLFAVPIHSNGSHWLPLLCKTIQLIIY